MKSCANCQNLQECLTTHVGAIAYEDMKEHPENWSCSNWKQGENVIQETLL